MSALVLALNPALDVEWRVDEVRWEEKNLVTRERRWAGGKGVNVARWTHFLGVKTRLLLPLGGKVGAEMKLCLRGEKIPYTVHAIRSETRANVVVSTAAGRQIRFNKTGPEVTRNEWRQVIAGISLLAKRSEMVVVSGSLPNGVSSRAYQEIIEGLPGKRVVLDCDGEAFRRAVAAKPFLVKPNEFELSQWAGQTLGHFDLILSAARKLSQKTKGWVMVSRGAHGAFLLNETERCFFRADSPRVVVRNSVGAGDAMLAAVAWQIERGTAPAEWLRWGIAAGASVVQSEGGILPSFAELRRMHAQISPKQLPVSRRS